MTEAKKRTAPVLDSSRDQSQNLSHVQVKAAIPITVYHTSAKQDRVADMVVLVTDQTNPEKEGIFESLSKTVRPDHFEVKETDVSSSRQNLERVQSKAGVGTSTLKNLLEFWKPIP